MLVFPALDTSPISNHFVSYKSGFGTVRVCCQSATNSLAICSPSELCGVMDRPPQGLGSSTLTKSPTILRCGLVSHHDPFASLVNRVDQFDIARLRLRSLAIRSLV